MVKGILYINKYNNKIPYILVTVIALTFNLLTIHRHMPWLDEACFVDMPANLYLYGKWETHVGSVVLNESRPIFCYMPFFLFVEYLWMSIFGFSFIKMRFLSLIIPAIIGFLLIKITENLNENKLRKSAVLLFSIMFWFLYDLLLVDRMNRLDLFGALIDIILFYVAIVQFKSENKYPKSIIFLSAISIMTSLQSAVWIVCVCAFSFLIIKEKKKLYVITLNAISGLSFGMMLTLIYMCFFDQLKVFFDILLNMSATLNKFWSLARIYILPILGRPVQPIAEATSTDTFYDKFLDVFSHQSSICLFCVVFLLFVLNKPLMSVRKRNIPHVLILLSIFTIFFFLLAGRFERYYRWAAIYPMLMAIILFFESNRLKNCVISVLFAMYSIYTSYDAMNISSNDCYDNISQLMKRHPFKSTDRVATVFSTYYMVKPQTEQCFFYEFYPLELIGEIDYIIVPEPEKDGSFGYYWQVEKLIDYAESYKNNPSYVVSKIDTCVHPALAMYKITRKK